MDRVSFACTLLLSAFLKVSELRLKLIPSGRELDSWSPPEASIVFRVCVCDDSAVATWIRRHRSWFSDRIVDNVESAGYQRSPREVAVTAAGC